MKNLFTIIIALFLTITLFGQDQVQQLVSEGTALHDQGKFTEAVIKYKEALKIDNNSTLANYELSYTCLAMGNYEDAILYSKKVIDQKSDNMAPAYVVLGNALDMAGQSADAIKAYEKGLKKFPQDNMLNYNLAYTTFHTGNYEKAEKAAIKSILAKPTHASSHALLAIVMNEKRERIKTVLPLYYFLLLEPNSDRSLENLRKLKRLLNQGVEKQADNKININLAPSTNESSEWRAAETMISLLGATKYTAENANKTETELFVETTKSLFSILGELKKKHSDLWWDFYVTQFNNLVETNNYEAFCYYISQSANLPDVEKWIMANPDKMTQLMEWKDR